jgi:SET domain
MNSAFNSHVMSFLLYCFLGAHKVEGLSSSPCRLYLGPSSLSTEENPKLGLYAGVNYEENDIVGRPDIGIPLVDFTTSFNRRDEIADAVIEFLEGNLWLGEYGGAQWEGNVSTNFLIPGLGVLANYHSGSHNVEWVQSSVLFHGPDLPSGVSHPARGAISPFFNFSMRASKPIHKGMEILAFFGDVWDVNKTQDIYGEKLTRNDYIDADAVLDKILTFMAKYDSKMTPKMKEDILDFVLGKILGTAAGSHAKVIRSLIPAHPGKLQAVKEMGGTFAYRNADLVKAQKWLDKYAICVDNLESKPSTIPEAGRGAFATREIKKGQIIAPVPVLHVADEDTTFMFDIISKETESENIEFDFDMDKPRGQQLLVNYCFAHPESSMLLCPASPLVSQINHASPEKANARLTWSKNAHWGTAFDLHDKTPTEMAEYHHISLVMELFALRDIEDGEEVLIDYGRDWEIAWREHMANYKETDWSMTAEDLRLEYKQKNFKTRDELKENPYPEGVSTACYLQVADLPDGRRKKNEDDFFIHLYDGSTNYNQITGIDMFLCEVISYKESGNHFYNYTVIGKHRDGIVEVQDVPHSVITFINLPYSSDIHHRAAFRHPIGVSDVIFPQAWRDKRQKSNE